MAESNNSITLRNMRQEPIARTRATPTPLWSARIMMDDPELVEQVHRENIEAGARIFTIGTYSTTRCRLRNSNFEGQFQTLQQCAIKIADRSKKSGLAIAGDIYA